MQQLGADNKEGDLWGKACGGKPMESLWGKACGSCEVQGRDLLSSFGHLFFPSPSQHLSLPDALPYGPEAGRTLNNSASPGQDWHLVSSQAFSRLFSF